MGMEVNHGINEKSNKKTSIKIIINFLIKNKIFFIRNFFNFNDGKEKTILKLVSLKIKKIFSLIKKTNKTNISRFRKNSNKINFKNINLNRIFYLLFYKHNTNMFISFLKKNQYCFLKKWY